MSKINIECHDDNPPAFPRVGFVSPEDNEPISGNLGMALRDYFAAAALQGMMGNRSLVDNFSGHAVMAGKSYLLADAMIEARKGEP